MADPLSVASGIITVLQLTSTVGEYLNEVSGAVEDRRKVLAEVSSATTLLRDAAEQAQRDTVPITVMSSLTNKSGALEQLK